MTGLFAEKRLRIGPDANTVAATVARRVLKRVTKQARKGKLTHLALTGGTIGIASLKALAELPDAREADWTGVHFWWSDERFLPAGHPDRNEQQARDAMFDHLPIPAANIHAMPAADAGLSLDDAAATYATQLTEFAGRTGSGLAVPAFDITLLGVGPDGHIASLFPDRPEISITDRVAVAVRDSPKPPPERISLTRPVINASKRVWLVLSGADKAAALGLALAGADYHGVPAAGAKGSRQTVFFADSAAATQVPAGLVVPGE